MSEQRIVYVDGFNLFRANYHANMTTDTNGEPIGGLIGFLQQLKNLTFKFCPHQIIVIFDGPDAGYRRKQVCKDYKSKRPSIRTTSIKIEEEGRLEVNNEHDQLQKLYNFLKHLPIQLIIVPFYEADDVIAYLVKKNPDCKSVIISNDKDYLQLTTNKNVTVYQFSKRRLTGLQDIEKEYSIIPENFIYYRSIIGDTSDELKGVKGLGPEIFKKFTVISERKINSIDDFFQEIDKLEDDKSKKVKLLKESKKDILLMYQLMKLDKDCLNQKAIEVLKQQLESQNDKQFSISSFQIYCIKNNLNFQIKDLANWSSVFTPVNRGKSRINLDV